eukprot:Skav228768  [mRNA]  locus=scaffold589:483425:488612:- [translate_table: standard]
MALVKDWQLVDPCYIDIVGLGRPKAGMPMNADDDDYIILSETPKKPKEAPKKEVKHVKPPARASRGAQLAVAGSAFPVPRVAPRLGPAGHVPRELGEDEAIRSAMPGQQRMVPGEVVGGTWWGPSGAWCGS